MRTIIRSSIISALSALALTGACTRKEASSRKAERAATAAEPTTGAPAAPTTPAKLTPTRKGHAPINGVDYYYEVYGQGEPLLLLHGGLGSIEMFAPLLPAFADHREVIAVDLHGHGRTPLGNRKIDLVDQGRDLAGVLDQLGYAQVDVLGYSMGGGVAFQLAAQHPDKVRRLVLVSACPHRDCFYPEMLPMQEQVSAAAMPMMKDTPMYRSYVAIAPNPAEFPTLLDRMGELMRTPFDWRPDVKKLTMPTLVVVGDSDMFRLDAIVDFYKLLGGAQRDAGWQREHQAKNRLAVLPDVTHYDMFLSPLLPTVAVPFLDGKTHATTWAAQVDAQPPR